VLSFFLSSPTLPKVASPAHHFRGDTQLGTRFLRSLSLYRLAIRHRLCALPLQRLFPPAPILPIEFQACSRIPICLKPTCQVANIYTGDAQLLLWFLLFFSILKRKHPDLGPFTLSCNSPVDSRLSDSASLFLCLSLPNLRLDLCLPSACSQRVLRTTSSQLLPRTTYLEYAF
jgi:hypothetical protein